MDFVREENVVQAVQFVREEKVFLFVTFWWVVLKELCFFVHGILQTITSKRKFFKMLDNVVDFVREENVVQVNGNASNFKAVRDLLMKKSSICVGPHVLPIALIWFLERIWKFIKLLSKREEWSTPTFM